MVRAMVKSVRLDLLEWLVSVDPQAIDMIILESPPPEVFRQIFDAWGPRASDAGIDEAFKSGCAHWRFDIAEYVAARREVSQTCRDQVLVDAAFSGNLEQVAFIQKLGVSQQGIDKAFRGAAVTKNSEPMLHHLQEHVSQAGLENTFRQSTSVKMLSYIGSICTIPREVAIAAVDNQSFSGVMEYLFQQYHLRDFPDEVAPAVAKTGGLPLLEKLLPSTSQSTRETIVVDSACKKYTKVVKFLCSKVDIPDRVLLHAVQKSLFSRIPNKKQDDLCKWILLKLTDTFLLDNANEAFPIAAQLDFSRVANELLVKVDPDAVHEAWKKLFSRPKRRITSTWVTCIFEGSALSNMRTDGFVEMVRGRRGGFLRSLPSSFDLEAAKQQLSNKRMRRDVDRYVLRHRDADQTH